MRGVVADEDAAEPVPFDLGHMIPARCDSQPCADRPGTTANREVAKPIEDEVLPITLPWSFR
jgi:hypothetical protein